jgi:hypothetical protein
MALPILSTAKRSADPSLITSMVEGMRPWVVDALHEERQPAVEVVPAVRAPENTIARL